MNEMWMDIEDFEGLYQVSNLGRIKSLYRVNCQNKVIEEKFLTIFDNGHGYKKVHLTKNGKHKDKYVHRLVCGAFIPNPENKKEVNHKDGIKSNNLVGNLDWVTPSENQKHASMAGLHEPFPILTGKDNPKSRPVCQFTLSGKLVMEYESLLEAQKETGINHSGISSVCSGKQDSAGKFMWRYKEDAQSDSIEPCKSSRVRPINQFDLKGNFIREFMGCTEASRIVNLPVSSIHLACKNKSKTSGFIWDYA
jgi:hypothetical protein